MIRVVYAVCSEREHKPVTRSVLPTRADAEQHLLRLRREEAGDPEESYWIAELGPESESWRRLIGESVGGGG
jgi:hypothetical protein